MRILVVEDERDLNQILVKKLTIEGYGVDACFDGDEALDYIQMTDYDAIVLDIMMPKTNGLSVLQHMRAQGNATPVLFLTARDSIDDRVTGLDKGANDYLVKPFSLKELMARIRVLIREKDGNPTGVYTAGDLMLDVNRHVVERAGKVIELSAKEFAILEYFIRNKNIVLSREKFEEHIWSYDFESGSNVVDVYIRYLRKKLDDDFEQKLIHTVRGYGYILKDQE